MYRNRFVSMAYLVLAMVFWNLLQAVEAQWLVENNGIVLMASIASDEKLEIHTAPGPRWSRDNVGSLQVAWTFSTGVVGDPSCRQTETIILDQPSEISTLTVKIDGVYLLVNNDHVADLHLCFSGSERNSVAVGVPIPGGARMRNLIGYSIVDGGNATRGTGFVDRVPISIIGVEDPD